MIQFMPANHSITNVLSPNLHVLFFLFAHWYVINAIHYQEYSFQVTYWKRVYTRIFTATLHLLKGIIVGFFFFAKLIPKSPKSWLSMFSVPCLKYCRSVQELWDSVHCINHKYIGMFWYWTGISKSREWSCKNFSICIHLHTVLRKPPPPPSGEQRKSICMRHTCTMHTCTYIPIYFSFRSLSMSQPGLESLFKNSTIYICTRFGPPKAPASLLVTTQ